MGKVKEQLLNSYETMRQYCSEGEQPGAIPPLYSEDRALEQEIAVGDMVRVYDSHCALQPKEGLVLYKKQVADSNILSVELQGGSLLQVYEIQCMKLNRRMPRVLYVRLLKDGSYEVSHKKQGAGWARFREEL